MNKISRISTGFYSESYMITSQDDVLHYQGAVKVSQASVL